MKNKQNLQYSNKPNKNTLTVTTASTGFFNRSTNLLGVTAASLKSQPSKKNINSKSLGKNKRSFREKCQKKQKKQKNQKSKQSKQSNKQNKAHKKTSKKKTITISTHVSSSTHKQIHRSKQVSMNKKKDNKNKKVLIKNSKIKQQEITKKFEESISLKLQKQSYQNIQEYKIISKLQIEEELTDRKKNHLEYFMYKNKKIPIENTQQRKLAFKIKFIDERSISYCPSKSNRVLEQQNKDKKQQKKVKQQQLEKQQQRQYSQQQQQQQQVNIQKYNHIINQKYHQKTQIITTDKSIEVDLIDSQQNYCQTDSNKQIAEFKRSTNQNQNRQKCFTQTLSELQFLYLPDSSNFQGFSIAEKTHYKQLLLYLAKKFDQKNQQTSAEFDPQTIQILLNQRQQKQKGISTSYLSSGIPTHAPSIISYLCNFFCYMQLHEKKGLIARLNSSYGYTLQQKLSLISKGKHAHRHCRLISQATFWAFEQQLHEGLQLQDQLIEHSLHYHNRAIFDCVNQFIEQFQPYYSSNGQPFPWSYNLQTTFYCIDEQSFGALNTQIKQKIWQCSQTLSGLILDIQPQKKQKQGQPVKHKAHIHRILENQRAMLTIQNKKYSNTIEMDQARTYILLQVSQLITNSLVSELIQYLKTDSKINI